MIFDGIVDFPHAYSGSIHKIIIDKFMDSNDRELKLDWVKMGYKSAKACRGSWYASIWKWKIPLKIYIEDNYVVISKNISSLKLFAEFSDALTEGRLITNREEIKRI